MLLKFKDGRPFATGGVGYNTASIDYTAEGIILDVAIAENPTQAVVDIGVAYLVCSPDLATVLEGDIPPPIIAGETILLKGEWVEGSIHEVELVLFADDNMGTGTNLMVKMFVPTSVPGRSLEEALPISSLGWLGCLDAICFAIDPNTQTFYYS